MDEVRAAQALQRVAYAEDWLGRLRDDLASGHRRAAFTHLMTARAELNMLTEQLALELGIVEEVSPAEARSRAGLPARSPLSWAALGASAVALFLFSLQVLPGQLSRSSVDATQPAPIVAVAPAPATVPVQTPRLDRFLANSAQFQALLARASAAHEAAETPESAAPTATPPRIRRQPATRIPSPTASLPAGIPADPSPVAPPTADPVASVSAPTEVPAAPDKAFVASLLAAKAFFNN